MDGPSDPVLFFHALKFRVTCDRDNKLNKLSVISCCRKTKDGEVSE